MWRLDDEGFDEVVSFSERSDVWGHNVGAMEKICGEKRAERDVGRAILRICQKCFVKGTRSDDWPDAKLCDGGDERCD